MDAIRWRVGDGLVNRRRDLPDTIRDAMEITRAVEEAELRLQGIVSTTPLQPSARLSELYGANILIKREDGHLLSSKPAKRCRFRACSRCSVCSRCLFHRSSW